MYDDLDGDGARQTAVLRKVRTEGVETAYETALAICKDPKAPAQARAIASRTIFQLAGMLNKPEPETPKEPSEMTAEELEQSRQAFIRKRDLMRGLSGNSQRSTGAEDKGLFG